MLYSGKKPHMQPKNIIQLTKCLDASALIRKEYGAGKKKSLLCEGIYPVSKAYILFLSVPFEDGNTLNYNNLTHVASPALSIAICCIYLIGCWLVYPVCVYIDVCVNCKQKQVIP